MPLPTPILDDRTFEQLREELVRRIPAYAPEWTDHNPSDPGIALLELLAFLGENLLYRFNQIPEATRLAFLRLLHIPLRPPQPARALVAMETDVNEAPGLPGVLVEQGTLAQAGKLPFETLTEVRVLPVSILGVVKAMAPEPDVETEPEVFEFFQRALDALDALDAIDDDDRLVSYENVLVSEDGSGPAVDLDSAVDQTLWIAVLCAEGEDPLEVRDALATHPRPPVLMNVGFVPDLRAPAPADTDPCPGADVPPPTRPVEWQISSGRLDERGMPIYRALPVVGDTTGGLSREGVVRLELPAEPGSAGVFALEDPERAGTGELPPRLDDELEERLVFWLRVFRHDRGSIGKVRHVSANAAEVQQSQTASAELLGAGTGQPDQAFKLLHAPVLPGTLIIEIEDADGWRAWTEVDGFHASDAEDRHFVLDHEAGEVRFGTGLAGHAPPLGARVRARSYRHGGGAEGNVAARTINRLPAIGNVDVENLLPAHSGADGETVAEALERIPGELRRRDRAVTKDDFRELALMTPGVDVARAECLPRFYPPTRQTDAAGVVTVMVWPRDDAARPRAPAPDRRMLAAVCRWLDARRLITTELLVVAPSYRKIAVAVGVRVKPDHGIEAVRRWVEVIIRQYLAPLPPYGPEGKGWPLGRRVHGPELEAVALQVEGVEYLEGLEVAGYDAGAEAWTPGTVMLDIDEVPELVEITVVEGQPLAPGQPVSAPLEDEDPPRTPVPVPILREEC